MTHIGVAVPAAGLGRRMGGLRKPWLELRGEPLLRHTLRALLAVHRVEAVRVAVAPDDVGEAPRWLQGLDPRVEVVEGGDSRSRSVREAVRALPAVDFIVVHDAARPLVTPEVVERCVRALEEAPAGMEEAPDGVVAGWPATDTLKAVDDGRWILETLDRERVWHAQTPQVFPAEVLRSAYERLEELGPVTDDASLVEALGGRVRMIKGDPRNIKVTRPGDLPVAERYLEMRGSDGGQAGRDLRRGGA